MSAKKFPIKHGDVFITDPSLSPEKQMDSIREFEISQSPDDVLAKKLIQRLDHEEERPIDRDELVYFLAGYANHNDLGENLEETLDLWLQERREYMQTDTVVEQGG